MDYLKILTFALKNKKTREIINLRFQKFADRGKKKRKKEYDKLSIDSDNALSKIFPDKKISLEIPKKLEEHLNFFKKNLPELFGDMQLFTGAISPEKRKEIWRTADLIFSTPQCIANDVKKGLYNLGDVCLLDDRDLWVGDINLDLGIARCVLTGLARRSFEAHLGQHKVIR